MHLDHLIQQIFYKQVNKSKYALLILKIVEKSSKCEWSRSWSSSTHSNLYLFLTVTHGCELLSPVNNDTLLPPVMDSPERKGNGEKVEG